MTEADVLRLALDGHLTLSVNFLNNARARLGHLVPIEQAETYELSDFVRGIIREEFCSEAPIRAFRGELVSESEVLECGGEIVTISGVWDLWLVGDGQTEVEHEYQQLTGGPPVELSTLGGFVTVKHPEHVNRYAWLQESFDDNPYQPGSLAHLEELKRELANAWPEMTGEQKEQMLEKHREQRKEYLKKREGKPKEHDYYPTAKLPEDARLVVRTGALQDFLANLSAPEATGERPVSTRERDTLLNAIAVLAATGWGWNGTEPYKLSKEVASAAALKGLSISDRTLGAKLKEAAQQLPTAAGPD